MFGEETYNKSVMHKQKRYCSEHVPNIITYCKYSTVNLIFSNRGFVDHLQHSR